MFRTGIDTSKMSKSLNTANSTAKHTKIWYTEKFMTWVPNPKLVSSRNICNEIRMKNLTTRSHSKQMSNGYCSYYARTNFDNLCTRSAATGQSRSLTCHDFLRPDSLFSMCALFFYPKLCILMRSNAVVAVWVFLSMNFNTPSTRHTHTKHRIRWSTSLFLAALVWTKIEN